MNKIQTKEIINRAEWEGFLENRKEANFLQSWEWGEFHNALNHTIIRSGFFEGDKLCGVMLSVVEKARRATYLTIPGGPIIDWESQGASLAFKSEAVRIAKENNCSFVRVRPQLASNDFSKKIFSSLRFKTSPMHLHAELTNQLDVTKTPEELLANMRKGTRYEIKKAEKIGIRVKESKDAKEIEKFYELQLDTAKRQGFVPFSLKFLQEQFRIFASANHAILYSSYFEKKLLAMGFVIFYGNEAVYHYGASTQDGREYPGAYLIQWHAILEAKNRGMETYNFWGVAKEEGHRFANLSMFKRGFGGVDFEYLHAQDLVIKPIPYFINYIIENARKRIRKV